MRRIGFILVLAAVSVIAAGVALAAARDKAPAKPHAAVTTVRHSRSTGATPARVAAVVGKTRLGKTSTATGDSPGENTPGDPDNVQQGDQNAPDSPSAGAASEDNPAAQGEGESTGDPETGQPGEPAAGAGHQDTGAGANHECSGDCIE